MVIGYYPGGGGHRYYHNLIGKDYSVMGIAYDNLTSGIGVRGLYFDKAPDQQLLHNNILLHCVSSIRIREFVTATPLIIIKSDLKKSLRREWSIKGKYVPMFYNDQLSHELMILELYQAIKAEQWPSITTIKEFNSLPPIIYNECMEKIKLVQSMTDTNSVYNFINAAYTSIGWHHELYKKWPIETSLADVVIDIDNDNSDFALLMRQELDLYNNALFDFAWDVYENYGSNAPINSLYEQKFLKQ